MRGHLLPGGGKSGSWIIPCRDRRHLRRRLRLQGWLEDLRYSYNTLYCLVPGDDYATSKKVEPVIINSAYRSEEVNERCGGSRTSNHLTGCAADIRCLGPEQMIRYAAILLDIADGTKRDFDELLLEKRGTTYWIHFAVRPEGNRRRITFDMR